MDVANWKLVQDGFTGRVYRRTLVIKRNFFTKKEKTVERWILFMKGTYHDALTVFLKMTGLDSHIEVKRRR